jgi:DUF4097 and DUF4098 domain-containing protein YvlB
MMRTFETASPIAVTVEVGVGDVRIAASERGDTVVEVQPRDSSRRDDVVAAEQTRIEFERGRLLVKTARGWRRWSPFGDGGAVDVRIELPEGSEIAAETAVAELRATGRLGACRCTAAAGGIRLEEAGTVRLRTSVGDIDVDRVTGDADVGTSSGAVRLGAVAGNAVVKNSSGDNWIGEAAGDVRVSAGNGAIAIDRARHTVAAKSGMGSIRLGEVSRGSVVATTGMGSLEIGIGDGAAAWLDLGTGHGRVTNELEDAAPPAAGESTVDVRAQTGYGDVTVRRA